MIKKISIVLFVLGALTASGQKNNDKKADRYFKDLGYAQYIQLKGKEDLSSLDDGTLKKLGISYRKIGDSKNAERVYKLLVDKNNDDALTHLYYAQALQSNGNYPKSSEHYKIAHDKMEADAAEGGVNKQALKGYEACNQVDNLKAKGKVKIRNVRELNGSKLDFSPMYYQDGVVFVSTRSPASVDNIDHWLNDNCMDLYYAEQKGERFEKPKPFSDELNTPFHEGPVTFVDNQQQVFFTRNNFNENKRGVSEDRITKLKIYSAKQVKGVWKKVEELPFNDKNIDVCHPALSPDEKVMVFSSSRKTDSQGGMDLFITYWEGERWSEPKNLGPEINTAGNELFPYIHTDGQLYFASNGHKGLGGLDMYTATLEQEDDQWKWLYPINLGAPFNSRHDDFGLIMRPNKEEGFFTSNRKGGKGEDDIYAFTLEKPLDELQPKPLFPMQICVYDKKTNNRIEGATVSIGLTENKGAAMSNTGDIVVNLAPVEDTPNEYRIRIKGNENATTGTNTNAMQYTTNDEGVLFYSMQGGEEYFFEVRKNGYLLAKERFKMPMNSDLEEYCIPLIQGVDDPNNPNGSNTPNGSNNPNSSNTPNGSMAIMDPSMLDKNKPYIIGNVINKEYNRPLAGSDVTLLNRCTGEEITVRMDAKAEFAFQLECGCDYVLKGRKDNFIGANKIISLVDPEKCKEPLTADLLLNPGFDEMGNPIMIGGKTITERLKTGDLIELKRIYYDFDEYYIRDDASEDLDVLVALMRQFKSMEVELSSHTDARATHQYNETLSSNRAKSAKEYLVKRGIDASRIIAVGYGETRLKNKCKDGVNCSEYEHQRNRRTEVLITKFDEGEYIKLKYQDNEPTKVDPKPRRR